MLDGTFQTGTFQTGRNISNDLHPNVGNRHPIWCSSEFSRCLCALCIKLHLCNLAQSLIPSPHAHTGTLFNAWHSRKHPPHAHTGTVFDPWHSRKPSPHAHTGTVFNAWHSRKQRHPTHTLAQSLMLGRVKNNVTPRTHWHSLESLAQPKTTSPHAHTGTVFNAWHSRKQRHPTHILAQSLMLGTVKKQRHPAHILAQSLMFGTVKKQRHPTHTLAQSLMLGTVKKQRHPTHTLAQS